MAKQRPSVRKREREQQKRQRERKKAEKAALKRERRERKALGEPPVPEDEVPVTDGEETGTVGGPSAT